MRRTAADPGHAGPDSGKSGQSGQSSSCRIQPYTDQGGAPRRAAGPVPAAGSALGGPPAAHRAALVAQQDQHGYRGHARCSSPSSSLSIVQLAATASRIGCADPRHSVHSPGFGAYEEGGDEQSSSRRGPDTAQSHAGAPSRPLGSSLSGGDAARPFRISSTRGCPLLRTAAAVAPSR